VDSCNFTQIAQDRDKVGTEH